MLIRVNDYMLELDCIRALIPKMDNQKPPKPCMILHYKDNSASDVVPYDVGKKIMDMTFGVPNQVKKEEVPNATNNNTTILRDEKGNKIIDSKECSIGE